jgi:hypothetical protein
VPVQTKKKRVVMMVPPRQMPNLSHAWDYMAELDREAIIEIVNKYRKLDGQASYRDPKPLL